MNKAYSTHIHSIKDTIGMTGQWYIFEKKDKLGNSFDSLYPSRLLGFISINGEHEAVVQCSLKPLS